MFILKKYLYLNMYYLLDSILIYYPNIFNFVKHLEQKLIIITRLQTIIIGLDIFITRVNVFINGLTELRVLYVLLSIFSIIVIARDTYILRVIYFNSKIHIANCSKYIYNYTRRNSN